MARVSSWRPSSARRSAAGSPTTTPGAGFSTSTSLLAWSRCLVSLFVTDPPYIRARRASCIDYPGFAGMAGWLGALQLVLDKGQEAYWHATTWIVAVTVLSGAARIAFIWRELSTGEPIVDLRVLKDRNFAVGAFLTSATASCSTASPACCRCFCRR